MLMLVALIILSLYDIFAGVVIISRLYNFFLLVSIFSSLKGIWSIVSDIPFRIFPMMGMIDLVTGIVAFLLFLGENIWFYPFIGILILLKGFYCLTPTKK